MTPFHVKLKNMNIKRVKNIAALLLILCLVLPMSRCVKIGPPHPEGDTTIQKKDPTEYSYLIPLAEIEIKNPSTYLILLAFTWPFPLWFIKSKYKKKWCGKILNTAEFVLLVFSWYLIINWTFYFGEPYWGGYIAVASLTVLSTLFIYQAVIDFKSKDKTKTNLTINST